MPSNFAHPRYQICTKRKDLFDSEFKKDGYVYVVKDDCESRGFELIKTKEECSMAAKTLGIGKDGDANVASNQANVRREYCGTWSSIGGENRNVDRVHFVSPDDIHPDKTDVELVHEDNRNTTTGEVWYKHIINPSPGPILDRPRIYTHSEQMASDGTWHEDPITHSVQWIAAGKIMRHPWIGAKTPTGKISNRGGLTWAERGMTEPPGGGWNNEIDANQICKEVKKKKEVKKEEEKK